ncbi:MAG: trigger factor [Verrucomicrobiota bacterium]
MNIEVKDVSPSRKSLVISLAVGEVDAEHQAVVAEFARMARLPGFRPGKAPAAMVAKRYAKEIGDEFKQKIVAKAYREGNDQAKLEVVQVVAVEEGAIAQGAPATITVTVDVRPDFALPDLVGFTAEVSPEDPTDAEVEAMIDSLRAERADFQPAARAARKGDYVKLSYEGRVDGKPVAELAPDKKIYDKVPQTWEEIEGATDGIIPGLGQQLGGMAAGDKRDVTVTFPADFAPVPALAGKTAIYAVELQEVRERVLPPLDEVFFKTHQADSLDTLTANVRNQLKLRRAQENQQAKRNQIVGQLTQRAGEFAVPDSLVEEETQGILRRFIEENMRRGMPAEQFEKDKAQLYEGARKSAVARVRTRFLLAKVAEQEKLTVTSDDLNNFLYREAVMSGQRPEKLAKELGKDRERVRAAQQSIVFDKALDLLVSRATVTTIASKPAA